MFKKLFGKPDWVTELEADQARKACVENAHQQFTDVNNLHADVAEEVLRLQKELGISSQEILEAMWSDPVHYEFNLRMGYKP